jgi:DNA-directed RNA polymerase specialized sigma24 family protein
VYDLEVADIAETMGCSVGTVKVHLSRARATLATRLAVAEEDPS